jgi:hypothetical protein
MTHGEKNYYENGEGYIIRDTGCSCCSEEYILTKEEYLTLLKGMVEKLTKKIKKVEGIR